MLKEWLKKRSRKSQSISKTENTTTDPLPPSNSQEKPSIRSTPSTPKISTHTVTLDQFIACLCDEDYSVLSNELSKEQLEKVWFDIYQEYVDTVCSQSTKHKITVQNSIRILELKINKSVAIHMYLYIQQELKLDFDPKVIEIVRHIGAMTGENVNVKKLEGQIKMWTIELQQAEKKLEQIDKDLAGSGSQGKTTRDSFQDFIVAIELYVKYPISGAKTTVDRFLAMIKNYLRYCAAQEEQLAKMK